MRSFTKNVKEEIIKNTSLKTCCQKTLFETLIYFNSRDRSKLVPAVYFSSSFAPLARLVLKLAKKFSRQKSIWGFKKNKKGKNYTYIVYLPEKISRKNLSQNILTALKKKCCRRSFITGLFLNCGSISPADRGYHLELRINAKTKSPSPSEIIKLFKKEYLIVKYHKHDKVYRIYLKKSDEIAKMLILMKAHSSLLKFEESRAIKETKNEIQRKVNCETANLDKIMEASLRQLKSIEKINEKIGLNNLPKDLIEAVILRLEGPDKSLQELALQTEPRISRLQVGRKLKKIEEIAGKLGGKNYEKESCD